MAVKAWSIVGSAAILASIVVGRGAGNDTLVPTPPMGWNSWDSYGLSITQDEYEANVRAMAERLRPHGWTYAVVDEGWYLENPEGKAGSFRFAMDGNGRYTPAINRFPSAAHDAGFGKLAEWVHGQGLKFGIHIIRGIPREAVEKNLPIAGSRYGAADAANKSDVCAWNADNYGVAANAAGQAYYDSIAALYGRWGVDFVKIDCISHPYIAGEIHMFSGSLRKTGRPIVLSLSPGPTPLDQVNDLRQYAQMWRISGDVWDHWKQWPGQDWSQGVLGQFELAAKWAPYVQPGHWPDADMLPVGYLGPRPGQGKVRKSALTADEQRTLVTLWCMLRSPLMAGMNLTQLDEFTASLLTNDEVLSVNQHSAGGHPVLNDGKTAVWVGTADKGQGIYVALFNLDDTPQTLEYSLAALGLGAKSFQIRDLWQKQDLGSSDHVKVTLAPHASTLDKLS